MCIRDRDIRNVRRFGLRIICIDGNRKLIFSDGELTWGNESGINLGNSLPTFVGPVAAGGWATCAWSEEEIDIFISVSYTHLDVYKRQVVLHLTVKVTVSFC